VSRILVIDDEPALGENIQRMLRLPGATVAVMVDPARGLAEALANPPDLVLLDIRMPGMSGEELFSHLHEAHPGLPIVFLTAFGSVEGAVIAMRNGAFDYLQKPFKREDLLLVVKRALSHASLEHEVARLKGRLESLGEADAVPSRSSLMLDLMERCRRAAGTDATVMILGESGTGKEVTARFIHEQSRRKDGPLVPVECSAMPGSLIESELFGYERGAFTGADRSKKGLIESADGGTLFLDEIGDLGVELQTRLFRFVEERALRRLGGVSQIRVDCRIVCATNQDLAAKIKAGTFREELYYRLSVVTMKLPPLRDRPEDIPHLARFFLERFSRRYGKSLSGSPQFYEERDGTSGGIACRRCAGSGGSGRGHHTSDPNHTTRFTSVEGCKRAIPLQLREQLRTSSAVAMRRQRERRGARSWSGSEDVLHAAKEGQGSAKWGIISPLWIEKRGMKSPMRFDLRP